MNELLQQLTEMPGVSGDEHKIRGVIRKLIADHVDDVWVDTMGNLIAIRQGTVNPEYRILVDAHMDEVGLMITSVDRDGTLKFKTVGGIGDRTLLGKVVQVGPKKLIGVVGARPIHLLTGQQRSTVVKRDAMRIDIGAKNKDEANRKVKPGDTATFVTTYEEMGDIALGKAFDDRAGCAALVELLRADPYPFTIIGAFTVQEEVGIRGAGVATYATKPDIALVLECTPAYDLPNKRDVSPNVTLGKGPSIYVMDRGTIQHPGLVKHITGTADKHGIPYQIRQPGGGGTNTAAIQRITGGIPAATIATPARYIHSPTSMINLNDFKNVIRLADAAIRSLDPADFKRNGKED